MKSYPVLPLRNTVLFPNQIIPIYIGRKESLKLIDHVSKSDEKQIIVVAQKDGSIESPKDKDLYEYGTLATVMKVFGMPDNSKSAIVKGIRRIKIDKFSQSDPYFTGTFIDVDEKISDTVEMDALCENLKTIFYALIIPLICLMISLLAPGETVLVPDPCYPIHSFSVLIARGNIKEYDSINDDKLLENIERGLKSEPKPKALIISFPSNPTTQTVDLDFFTEIVSLGKKYSVIVIHDFAYADICFDDFKAPSFLQAAGAIDVGVESFSLSKSYNMAGWRVGFMCGNKEVISALKRVKSYLDYGIFQPIQISAITALNETQDCVNQIRDRYKMRRNRLVDGLNKIGWEIEKPKATMFVWAKIPDKYLDLGSLEFSKKLIKECSVAVSPGIGFGSRGDEYVRFALIENEQRIQQAAKSMKKLFK